MNTNEAATIDALSRELHVIRAIQAQAELEKQQAAAALTAAAPHEASQLALAASRLTEVNGLEKKAKADLVAVLEAEAIAHDLYGRALHPNVEFKRVTTRRFVFTQDNLLRLYQAAVALDIVDSVFTVNVDFLPADTPIDFVETIYTPKAYVDGYAKWPVLFPSEEK